MVIYGLGRSQVPHPRADPQNLLAIHGLEKHRVTPPLAWSPSIKGSGSTIALSKYGAVRPREGVRPDPPPQTHTPSGVCYLTEHLTQSWSERELGVSSLPTGLNSPPGMSSECWALSPRAIGEETPPRPLRAAAASL